MSNTAKLSSLLAYSSFLTVSSRSMVARHLRTRKGNPEGRERFSRRSILLRRNLRVLNPVTEHCHETKRGAYSANRPRNRVYVRV